MGTVIQGVPLATEPSISLTVWCLTTYIWVVPHR